ncbi:hypothetical protein AMK59_2483 [Oryctes borbonicus]|uniref:Uncharacterized protein n=1 Tax=Oryctes borbonicus TaxID=1629725 RepID=A0A0T6BAK7_9SCAR|nr:hypothetical protein AMK59_2483 [Oryctes borbonicus]
MTTPTFAAMATTAGMLIAAQRPQDATPIDPSKLSQTLDEILESVESLADQKHVANEDFPCQVNGSWISEAGGVRLEISHKGNNLLDVAISEAVGRTKKTPAQGFLSENSWNITGLIPLEKKSMVILNAVDDSENQLATFIGECKAYSRFIQVIWGHWLVGRSSNATSESIFSQEMFLDVFERESIRHHNRKGNNTDASNAGTTKATTESSENGTERIRSAEESSDSRLKLNVRHIAMDSMPFDVIVPKLNLLEKSLNDVLRLPKSKGNANVPELNVNLERYSLSKDILSRFALLDQHLLQDISARNTKIVPQVVDEKFIVKNLSATSEASNF